jgi:hypothetical protein
MQYISSDFVPLLRLSSRRVVYDDALVDLWQDSRDWFLAIHMDYRRHRWGSVRHYRVSQQPADMNGWSFLVEFVGGDGDDVGRCYNCFVAADEAPDFCDCLGSLSRDYCVHRSVLRWLLEKNVLALCDSQDAIQKNNASDIARRDGNAHTDTTGE